MRTPHCDRLGSSSTNRQPALPRLRRRYAFVVQFTGARDSEGQYQGRVEHVVSGEAKRFFTWAELAEFFDDMLRRSGDETD